MRRASCLIIIFLLVSLIPAATQQSWIDSARIAGGVLWPDMTDQEMTETIDELHEGGQSVILTWVSDPLLEGDWSSDLQFLEKASAYLHENYPDMALIIYQGPLEIVTPDVDRNKDGAADEGTHSIYTDHPEWLQVGMDGRKAVFYGDVAFWVGEVDEDVWLCPNDPEYSQIVKSNFRRLAGTGIDGIWVDIPKFLCDFGDWEDNWACHCEDCRRKFREDTGSRLPDTVDWDDKTWKTWILWRQNVITSFIKELNDAIKAVNPVCELIVEHWHGIDVGSVREAWSPVLLRRVTDCLAHEYPAASYSEKTHDYYNYLRDLATYLFYRGLDTDHPSWILAYSSDGEGQRMLSASVLTAGCNFYDTKAPYMSGTADLTQQKKIFAWIDQYAEYYHGPEMWANVGVYYSKGTIDFYQHEYEGDFYTEFMGISMMLLEFNVPYKVLFSLDDLDAFHTVILPNTACMGDTDIEKVKAFVEQGGQVVATGEAGQYDEWGEERTVNPLPEYAVMVPPVGMEYYRDVRPFYDWWIPEERGNGEEATSDFSAVLEALDIPAIFEVDAERIIILPFVKENTLILRVLNLSGISDSTPDLQEIRLHTGWPVASGTFYPFLSSPETVDNPGEVTVEDHGFLVYDVTEPVTVVNNAFDEEAGEFVVSMLHRQGFPVEKSSCHVCLEALKSRKHLVILGGHQARVVTDVVSLLLTEEEKASLEEEGAQKVFVKYNVFSEGQTIIIIAGSDRENTFKAARTWIGDILHELSNAFTIYETALQ
ncbi:MAG: beta-galactosidase trimerization domain-containing protein [Theionarchaea archaeon]|nr:beta-galactosidase trimerization domain-containing protein [Theionarchaea archaeon]MBU7036694.1 beta-galactosidase trimerization domain-containing protein [Theionarchaea archaeon]